MPTRDAQRRDRQSPHPAPTTSPTKMTDTLKDSSVPTVKPVDPTPRHKMGRSVTSNLSPPQTTTSPNIPRTNRSQSQDSVAQSVNSDRRRHQKPKKGSMHADIIDRLDFSGMGAAMFHHDGPFDACAPSRNRHRTKAPMLAWSNSSKGDPGNPPPVDTFDVLSEQSLAYVGLNDSPYPPPVTTSPKPHRTSSDIAGKGRLSEALPRKRPDALAEAWGVHEPEPYEEFLAGGGSGRASAASSMYRGKESNVNATTTTAPPNRRNRDNREVREVHLEQSNTERLSVPNPRRGASKNQLPPPKPISLPGGGRGGEDASLQQADEKLSSSPTSGGSTKRSRSLMHRIRKMRETPNVPVNSHDDDDSEPSPSSSLENQAGRDSRPGNRGGHSFLGRFGRTAPGNSNVSPLSDKSDFVIIDDAIQKSLPTLPPDSPDSMGGGSSAGEAYFDRTGENLSGSPGGIARKTSLMRKVVRGVKRAGKA